MTRACAVMAVSTSAYYDWHATGRQAAVERQRRDAELTAEIRAIHAEHPDYGSPRVTVELARRGRPVNHKRVETMMAAAGIVARRHRRRRGLTRRDETAAPLPDLVGRLFDPDRLDHTWAGDVTSVATDEGWLYLATVLDLGSRRLLGYSMSQAADTDHVINAVAMAVAARGRTTMAGTIFHSDRGSTYTSARYRQTCTDLELRQSAGRTGSCLDNAAAESFFATLKQELGRRHFATRADARRTIFAWINYYNQHRLHSACGYRPPAEYEQQLTIKQPPVGSRLAA
ncbi:MAG TPA: IS3 family transposase [Cryptosporangiaceae bacterium]|nr:IS3 family transposase [Cryptosporangiaceae bacterium]